MRRAALPDEAAAEVLENAIGAGENAPTAVRRIGVVRRVLAILRKGCDVGDLGRHGPNVRRDVQRSEQIDVRSVEVRYRARLERQCSRITVAGSRHEPMIEKIELDLERP